MAISPTKLRNNEILNAVSAVESACKRQRIKLKTGSQLHLVLSELRWLASHDTDPSEFGGAWTQDLPRARSAFLSYLQLQRLAKALTYATDKSGIEPYQNQLQNLACEATGREVSKARDLFFELQIAERLDGPFGQVSFGEPDVVLTDAYGGNLLVACKRPQSLESVGNAVNGGCDQIRDLGRSGVVAVNLDRAAGGFFPPERSDKWPSLPQFEVACGALMAELVEHIRPAIEEALPADPHGKSEALDPGIIMGVSLHNTFIGATEVPVSIAWSDQSGVVVNPAFPAAEDFVRVLLKVPPRGEPAASQD